MFCDEDEDEDEDDWDQKTTLSHPESMSAKNMRDLYLIRAEELIGRNPKAFITLPSLTIKGVRLLELPGFDNRVQNLQAVDMDGGKVASDESVREEPVAEVVKKEDVASGDSEASALEKVVERESTPPLMAMLISSSNAQFEAADAKATSKKAEEAKLADVEDGQRDVEMTGVFALLEGDAGRL